MDLCFSVYVSGLPTLPIFTEASQMLQTSSHIVNECPMTMLSGGLQRLIGKNSNESSHGMKLVRCWYAVCKLQYHYLCSRNEMR